MNTQHTYLNHLKQRNITPVIHNNRLALKSDQLIPEKIKTITMTNKTKLIEEMIQQAKQEIKSNPNNNNKTKLLELLLYKQNYVALKCPSLDNSTILIIKDKLTLIPSNYKSTQIVKFTLQEIETLIQNGAHLDQQSTYTVWATKQEFGGEIS